MANSLVVIVVLIVLVRTESVTDCDQYKRLRPNVFSVQGTGSLDIPTSIGTIIFRISVLNKDASAALKTANKQLSKAVRYMIFTKSSSSIGDLSKSIKFTTTGLTVSEENKYLTNPDTNERTKVSKGYRVVNILTVRTNELSLMGMIIDKGIQSGLKDISSISFGIDPEDQRALKAKLVENAVIDAQSRAKLALEPLGLEISGIKSVDINEYVPYHYLYQTSNLMRSGMGSGAASAPTQVFASTKNLDTRVTVGFIVNFKMENVKSSNSTKGNFAEPLKAAKIRAKSKAKTQTNVQINNQSSP